MGHWQKRNARSIQHLDPAKLDVELVAGLIHEKASDRVRAQLDSIKEGLVQPGPRPEVLDDFSRCGIETGEDIRELFEPRFYFGCEADDPMTGWAFNTKTNPFGARIRAVLSSDIGHWNVPDIREVLEEAYELVERGILTEADFRHFAFTHPVELYAGMNPDFFKGTVCEGDVEKLKKELSLA